MQTINLSNFFDIKDLFKTSGGKYVAPQVIEEKMKESRFIEQIMVLGENEKFVSDPFMEIIYVNLDNGQSTEIELDKSYFVNDNDILSTVFLKRYFDYRSNEKNFIFSQNYQLQIINFNFEDILINKNQYINLGDNTYTIENA